MEKKCTVSNNGGKCNDKAIAYLDNRVPVCSKHSDQYFRIGTTDKLIKN